MAHQDTWQTTLQRRIERAEHRARILRVVFAIAVPAVVIYLALLYRTLVVSTSPQSLAEFARDSLTANKPALTNQLKKELIRSAPITVASSFSATLQAIPVLRQQVEQNISVVIEDSVKDIRDTVPLAMRAVLLEHRDAFEHLSVSDLDEPHVHMLAQTLKHDLELELEKQGFDRKASVQLAARLNDINAELQQLRKAPNRLTSTEQLERRFIERFLLAMNK